MIDVVFRKWISNFGKLSFVVFFSSEEQEKQKGTFYRASVIRTLFCFPYLPGLKTRKSTPEYVFFLFFIFRAGLHGKKCRRRQAKKKFFLSLFVAFCRLHGFLSPGDKNNFTHEGLFFFPWHEIWIFCLKKKKAPRAKNFFFVAGDIFFRVVQL